MFEIIHSDSQKKKHLKDFSITLTSSLLSTFKARSIFIEYKVYRKLLPIGCARLQNFRNNSRETFA